MNSTWQEWFAEGHSKGWCSDIVCECHDGLPWTDEETELHQSGEEVCVTAVRIYTHNAGEPQ